MSPETYTIKTTTCGHVLLSTKKSNLLSLILCNLSVTTFDVWLEALLRLGAKPGGCDRDFKRGFFAFELVEHQN